MGFAVRGFFRRPFAHVNADVPDFAKRVRIYRPIVGGNMAYPFFVGDFAVDETRRQPAFRIDLRKVFGILHRERAENPVQYLRPDRLEFGRFPKRLEKRTVAEREGLYEFPVVRKHDVGRSVDVSAEHRVERKILNRPIFEARLDAVEIRTSSETFADTYAAIGGFGDEKVGISEFWECGHGIGLGFLKRTGVR